MLNNATARLYAARWALLHPTDATVCEDLAPKAPSALARALLLHAPLWLPRWVAAVLCAVLCPHLEAREITDGNVNFAFVVTFDTSHLAL